MDSMTAASIVARCHDFMLEVKTDGDRVTMRQVVPYDPPPADLLEAVRTHKAEVLEWLRFEERAALLWQAVFFRLRDRGDLPADPQFQELGRVAEAAHRRHDRPALVGALLDLEAYATKTRAQP